MMLATAAHGSPNTLRTVSSTGRMTRTGLLETAPGAALPSAAFRNVGRATGMEPVTERRCGEKSRAGHPRPTIHLGLWWLEARFVRGNPAVRASTRTEEELLT